MKITRLFIYIIVISNILQNVAFAGEAAFENSIAQSVTRQISPGLEYSNSIELVNGVRQEIFSFKFTPESKTKIVPAYGQYIYGFNSVGDLISNYEGTGSVVGGINTDFFITSTGIPLSCLISDREIISSCDNRPAIGFKENGKAVIGFPELTAEFVSDNRTIPVAHINKTPGAWGAYLVTDKFSSTTKTNFESIEIVFKSYEKDEQDIEIDNNSVDLEKENEIENDISDELGENEDSSINNVIDNSNASFNVKNSESDDFSDNDENADTTLDNPEVNLNSFKYIDSKLALQTELDVVVTEVRNGVRNGKIEKGTYVLCVPKEQLSYLVSDVQVGDRFVLKISGNEAFSECCSVFGGGSIVVENSTAVEHPDESIYKYRNPRTAAGITENGEIIFVSVDGRRAGKSGGFTIKELSQYLISLGCVAAINFDGGGSTTFYAKDIGEINANLKNTPSEGTERRIADGLLFVNTLEPSSNRAYGALYPNRFLVYNENVFVDISGDLKFADSNFYNIESSDDEKISLSVDSAYGITYNNIFIPNGKTGFADIIAVINDSSEHYYVGGIDITDRIDNLALKQDAELLTPFMAFSKLSITPTLKTLPVTYSQKSIDWKIQYKKEQNDDTNEEIWCDVDETEAYIYISDDMICFVPVIRGRQYKITATMGDYFEEILIYAENHPFVDMDTHWASKMSYEMFKLGFINGETDSNGQRFFNPSRNINVGEFCAILSRILKLDLVEPDSYMISDDNNFDSEEDYVSEESVIEQENEFIEETESKRDDKAVLLSDNIPEWALGYVYTLYVNGYITEFTSINEDGTAFIDTSKSVSRMEVIRVLGNLLQGEKDSEILNKYTDFVPNDETDILFFSRVTNNGILSGYEDGTVRQNETLTRAEAATVFSRFIKTFE